MGAAEGRSCPGRQEVDATVTDASIPSLPVLRPRIAASGLVFVERHLFRLSDPEAPALRRAPLPAADSPVTTGAGPDLVLFSSVLEDGLVHADLELWEHPVPEPSGPWDLTALRELEIAGPHIVLASFVSGLVGDCVIPVPAGIYTLRACCRGRAAAHAAFLTWLDAEEEEEEAEEGAEPAAELGPSDGIERWLLQLWPTPPAPTIT
ncbi:hypothetical protein AB0I53_04395 [Saccharopolyspora sp. NPDC050389]|uniref:hypothetical protein n=1 Tax=Saccharopolyspora sp. NPDC050389 TaxID=3155516 RepID=UPI00341054FA